MFTGMSSERAWTLRYRGCNANTERELAISEVQNIRRGTNNLCKFAGKDNRS